MQWVRGDKAWFWEDVWLTNSFLKSAFPRLLHGGKFQRAHLPMLVSLLQLLEPPIKKKFTETEIKEWASLSNLLINFLVLQTEDWKLWTLERECFFCQIFGQKAQQVPLSTSSETESPKNVQVLF